MKLFLRSILSLVAITAFGSLAFGQTPLYYQGGIMLNNRAQDATGPGDQNFNTAANWSTVPPNTYLTGSTSSTFPQADNIAVIQADLNEGNYYVTTSGLIYVNSNTPVPVTVLQTSQANTVAGFLVSNYIAFFNSSGTVNFGNTNGQAFTIAGTDASGGDFVVDGGVTLNYSGNGPLVVSSGSVVIGDDQTFALTTNNTLGGQGTFNIKSGTFTFDATGTTTSMVVGDSQSGTNGIFFGTITTGVVTQGAPATVAVAAEGSTAAVPAEPATGSLVTTGSSLILGYNSGVGSWSVTNGSILQTGTAASKYTIALGSNGGAGGLDAIGSTGTLTISEASAFLLGSNTSTKATDLQLGTVSTGAGLGTGGGSGTIIQNGVGSVVDFFGTATTVEVGDLDGGTGSYRLSNGTLNIGTNPTDHVAFVLGATDGAIGTLTQTGGVINYGNAGITNGSTFIIGGHAGATGTFTVSGGSDTFNNTIVLNGTLNINGGTFAIDQVKLTGAGTLNLGGGTLKFTGASATENYGFAGTLTGGTSTIDVSTSGITNFTFANALTGSGGVNLVGNGTTVFNFASAAGGAPAANSYTGSTGISGGTLNATGADFSSATAGTTLSFGTAATAASTVLNLTLTTNATLPQAITGSGQFNITYTNPGETLTLSNTAIALSTVNVEIGAAGGTAGTFAVYGGAFGTVGDNGTGSSVVIGNGTPGDTVSFGATTYTGSTTVNVGASLTAANLQGDVLNNGTISVAGNVGHLPTNVITNNGTLTAGNIVGDVTNSGPLTVTGAAGLAGNVLANSGKITVLGASGITGSVTSSGTVTTTTVGGDLTNSAGGVFTTTSAINTTSVGGNVMNGGLLVPSAPLVAVAPMTLPNATFTTNGTLNQTSTGTLTVRVNGNTADLYQINGAGASTLAGTLDAIGSTATGSTTFVVINDPNGTIDSSALTTGAATALFSAVIDPTLTTANQVVIETTQRPVSVYALTPNQVAVANSIDSSSNNLVKNTFNQVTAAAATSYFPSALEKLTPESLQYARNIAFENSTYLAQRMNGVDANLRNGFSGLDTNAMSVVNPGFESGMGRSLSSLLAYADPGFHSTAPNGVNYYPGEAGRSSPSPSSESESATPATFDSSNQVMSDTPNPYLADVHPGGKETPVLGEFIGGDIILADLNKDGGSSNAPSSKANYTAGDVTAGVSFRVTNNFAAGVLFDYNHTDADTDSSGGKTKVNSYSPGIYATYFEKGFYVNGLFSFGYNQYTNSRNTGFGIAASSPNGEQYVSDLDLGYDFHPDKHWIVGPTLGATYTHLDIDSFTETGAPGADLDVESQSVDSVRSRLGGHLIYQTNTGDVLLQPNLTAMWQHEFLADSSGITSSFNDFNANPFTIQTAAPSRDSALIGVGLTATLNNSMALYLNYLADVGASNYFSQSVIGGLKARF
jgi:uncharacterized protein YhjY with autotransporter beta-barrel domain